MNLARVVVLGIVALLAAGTVSAEPPRHVILPAGEDLATNAGFEVGENGRPAGWMVGAARGGTAEWGAFGIEGTKGLRLVTKGEGESVAYVNRKLTGLEPDVEIEITVWLRLTDYSGVSVVWARCDSASGGEQREGAFQNSAQAGYRLSGSTAWSPVTVRVTPSKETASVIVGVLARGAGAIEVDEFHVRRREKRATTRPGPARTGPGLFLAEGRYRVEATADAQRLSVLIPVPILWRDQIPLSFRVFSEPEGHVESVRLIKQRHAYHTAHVVLTDLKKDGKVAFRWEAHVLALPHEPRPIPPGIRVPVVGVPDDIKPWLASTWCCDTEDPAIRRVAEEIAKAGDTADLRIPETLARMREIFRAAKGRVSNLTASEALTKRGSCTSCANLGAALLRAQGIPARIVAGYPSWSGPLQTHYVVEYWLTGIGWRVMESTLCRDDRPGWEQIEVAVVRPNDETKGAAGSRKCAAGGVPYLSLTEHPGESRAYLVGDMPDKPYCDHRAVQLAIFEAPAIEWTEARARLAERWRQLTRAAVDDPGQVPDLAAPKGLGEAKSLKGVIAAIE